MVEIEVGESGWRQRRCFAVDRSFPGSETECGCGGIAVLSMEASPFCFIVKGG